MLKYLTSSGTNVQIKFLSSSVRVDENPELRRVYAKTQAIFFEKIAPNFEKKQYINLFELLAKSTFEKQACAADILIVDEAQLVLFESVLNFFNPILRNNFHPSTLFSLLKYFFENKINTWQILCSHLRALSSPEILEIIFSLNMGTPLEEDASPDAKAVMCFLWKQAYFFELVIYQFAILEKKNLALLVKSVSDDYFYKKLEEHPNYLLLKETIQLFSERMVNLASQDCVSQLEGQLIVDLLKDQAKRLGSSSQAKKGNFIGVVSIKWLDDYLKYKEPRDIQVTSFKIVSDSEDLRYKTVITLKLLVFLFQKHPNLQRLDISGNKLEEVALRFLAEPKQAAIRSGLILNDVYIEHQGETRPLVLTDKGLLVLADVSRPKISAKKLSGFFDKLYTESCVPSALTKQLEKWSSQEAGQGINQIYAYPELFLDAFFTLHNEDSLFRRWAMESEGRALINLLLLKDDFLLDFIKHKSFFKTLTTIYEGEDGDTSPLYGLSCDERLLVLSKILHGFELRKETLKSKTLLLPFEIVKLVRIATFKDRNKIVGKDSKVIDRDIDALSKNANSVISNFQKIGAYPAVIKTIQIFFRTLLEMVFPAEWEQAVHEALASQAPIGASQAPIGASQAPIDASPKKKNKRTLESYLLEEGLLFTVSKTEGSCKNFNEFVESLKPSAFSDFIQDPRFLEIFLKVHDRSATGLLHGESVFYRWLKHDSQMLPKLAQIIAEQAQNPRLNIGTLVSDALLCVSSDNTSVLHLIFQKKDPALLQFFKPIIFNLIHDHPQEFLNLFLTSLTDKQNQTVSSLLSVLLDYERETSDSVIGALFHEINQAGLFDTIQKSPFLVASPSLFFHLQQLTKQYPENTFFNVLLVANSDHLLEPFSTRTPAELFKTKEKRTRWAELFKQKAFFEVWSKYTFEEDRLGSFLTSCQQSIFLNLHSQSETELPEMLKHILSHPQFVEPLKKSQFKKMKEWLTGPKEERPKVAAVAKAVAQPVLASIQQVEAKQPAALKSTKPTDVKIAAGQALVTTQQPSETKQAKTAEKSLEAAVSKKPLAPPPVLVSTKQATESKQLLSKDNPGIKPEVLSVSSPKVMPAKFKSAEEAFEPEFEEVIGKGARKEQKKAAQRVMALEAAKLEYEAKVIKAAEEARAAQLAAKARAAKLVEDARVTKLAEETRVAKLAEEAKVLQLAKEAKAAKLEYKKLWTLLERFVSIIQEEKLTDIHPNQILKTWSYLSDPQKQAEFLVYLDTTEQNFEKVELGPKRKIFLDNTRALHAIYVLRTNEPIADMPSFLDKLTPIAIQNPWLMRTLIHSLVAYYRERPLDEPRVKELFIKWIAQSQDVTFFREFIAAEVTRNDPRITQNTLLAANIFLAKETLDLDEAKLLYFSLQFFIDIKALEGSWILKLIEVFNLQKIGEPLKITLDYSETIENKISEELPIPCGQFKEFICQLFMARQVTELFMDLKLTQNKSYFIRAQLQLQGLVPKEVDDKLRSLMGQELLKNPLAKDKGLIDFQEHLIEDYLPDFPVAMIPPLHIESCIVGTYFKSRNDLCTLMQAMVETDEEHYVPALVGSQAKFVAHTLLVKSNKESFNPLKDLDFDILCCEQSPHDLRDINKLEQNAMIWLRMLESKVSGLTGIKSQVKLYSSKKQIAWCSFKAVIAHVPLDFRFLFTSLSREETINLSRKDRVLASSAYFLDLRLGQMHTQGIPSTFDYIKPRSELTMKNMSYILWVIFCESRAGTFRNISPQLHEMLKYILDPTVLGRTGHYSKEKFIRHLCTAMFHQFASKMKELEIATPGEVLNALRAVLHYRQVPDSPTFSEGAFKQVSPTTPSPVFLGVRSDSGRGSFLYSRTGGSAFFDSDSGSSASSVFSNDGTNQSPEALSSSTS